MMYKYSKIDLHLNFLQFLAIIKLQIGELYLISL